MTNQKSTFNRQFVKCCEDGTSQKMNPQNLEKMSLANQDEWHRIWSFRKARPDIYKQGGPRFCSVKNVICSKANCPLLEATQ